MDRKVRLTSPTNDALPAITPVLKGEPSVSPAQAAKSIRAAIIGYGGAFNMGRAHAQWMRDTGRMVPVAVCDPDRARLKAAKEELGDVKTFASVEALLRGGGFDLVVIITPHNTHAKLAIACSQAGKHVVVEKPMCLTVREATAMIRAAKATKTTLTVFHNRRHDGDFLRIKELVDKGLIGDVFQVEMYGGGYAHPGKWWRADKAISGGAFYDWGAHYLDWLLNIVPGKVENVTGFFHKLVWMDATNEDQVQAVIRFASGCVADVQMSSIARAGKPRWRILGTKGAIVDRDGKLHVNTELDGLVTEMTVPYAEGHWERYYQNLAAHLLDGAPLEVKPEEARRVIAIMATAEKSSQSKQAEPVPYE